MILCVMLFHSFTYGEELAFMNDCKKKSICATCLRPGFAEIKTCQNYSSPRVDCEWTNQCSCHATCKTCDAHGSDFCRSCPDGYLLQDEHGITHVEYDGLGKCVISPTGPAPHSTSTSTHAPGQKLPEDGAVSEGLGMGYADVTTTQRDSVTHKPASNGRLMESTTTSTTTPASAMPATMSSHHDKVDTGEDEDEDEDGDGKFLHLPITVWSAIGACLVILICGIGLVRVWHRSSNYGRFEEEGKSSEVAPQTIGQV